MFVAGDRHKLEDYTDCNGVSRLAHAKSALSSSMLAYNFFHWVSPEHPLTWHGTTFDKVYFEVKFPVLAKNSDCSRNNSPSNMDVVLISDDCLTMLCIESKYTEQTDRHCFGCSGRSLHASRPHRVRGRVPHLRPARSRCNH